MPGSLYAQKLVCYKVGIPGSWYARYFAFPGCLHYRKLVCQEVGIPGSLSASKIVCKEFGIPGSWYARKLVFNKVDMPVTQSSTSFIFLSLERLALWY